MMVAVVGGGAEGVGDVDAAAFALAAGQRDVRRWSISCYGGRRHRHQQRNYNEKTRHIVVGF